MNFKSATTAIYVGVLIAIAPIIAQDIANTPPIPNQVTSLPTVCNVKAGEKVQLTTGSTGLYTNTSTSGTCTWVKDGTGSGTTGPTGPTGASGASGASGATGAAGAAGASGASGPSGAGGSVFTGSTGSTITSSATPAFSLADISVKSPIRFNISPVADVTGPTITNKSAGALFFISVTTDGTHTWSWNSIVSDNICPIYTQASATTTAALQIDVDGTTVHGMGCSINISGIVYIGSTVGASGTSPGASSQDCRVTSAGIDCYDGTSHYHMVIADTGASNNFLTAISASGVISKAQPSFSNLSGTATLSQIATQAANTVVGNYTSGSAAPTAGAAPAGGTSGCSGLTDAAIYTAGTGWGCHQIAGGNPITGGTTNAMVTAASATTLQTVGGTLVINGGTNVLAGALAANTRLLLTANVTQNTAALAVSQNFVTIECTAGVKITFATSSVDGIDISGNDDAVVGCILDGNSAQTKPVINITGSRARIENNVFQNMGVTSPTTANLYVNGGNGHLIHHNYWPAITDAIILFENTTTSTTMQDSIISDNLVDSFNPGSASLNGFFAKALITNSKLITGLKWLDNTIHWQGANANAFGQNMDISATGEGPGNHTWRGNKAILAGNSNDGFHLFGNYHTVFDGNSVMDDNSSTFAVQHYFSFGDSYHSTFSHNIIKNPSGFYAGDFTFADNAYNVIDGNICDGGTGNSTTAGCIYMFSTSGVNSHNLVINNIDHFEGAFASPCIRLESATGSFTTVDNQIIGNHCDGTGTTGQIGIQIVDTTGTLSGTFISGNYLSNLPTGISIGSGSTGTVVGNNYFDTITTRYSDSGTSTTLQPQAVADAVKTAQTAATTTATLFTPDSNAQFRIGGSINCDTSVATASVNITIGWTDPSNQAQTSTLGSAALCTTLGAASFGQLSFPFRAKAATNITYATSVANSPNYDVSVHLEQVTTK